MERPPAGCHPFAAGTGKRRKATGRTVTLFTLFFLPPSPRRGPGPWYNARVRRRSRTHRRVPPIPFLLLAAALTAAAAALLSLRYDVPWPISYLAGVNAATFLGYGYDKLASRRGLFRVPERTLHLLAFAGGTPGAFLAQGVFRHKTAKGSFRTAFWLLAAAQAAIAIWALWYIG